jgi:predicted ATP-grasp superfamily ATP-dependent carboligase
MGSSHAPAVLVMPTGYRAGPHAVRSLSRAGFRVVGAHEEGLLTGGSSLACRRPLGYPSPARDPDGFARAVGQICEREGVAAVLPAGEDTARAMATGRVPTPAAVVIGPTPRQYRALCDKAGLARTAEAAGVPHPRTAVVGHGGPSGPVPEPPCVVKPRISGEDIGDADAAVSARSVAERRAAVEALARRGMEAIVQEHVEGEGWIARCVRGPGTLEMVAFRVRRQYPRLAGTPSLQTTATAPAEMVGLCHRLLAEVDYRGPASVCFIEREGRLHVHDVNLRLSGTLGAIVRAGLDVPRRAVELALGIPGTPTGRTGRRVTYLRLDGEVAGLADALRGRGDGDGAAAIARSLTRGALHRDWMLDPPPYDPFWVGRLAGLQGLRAARWARRRVAPAAGGGRRV